MFRIIRLAGTLALCLCTAAPAADPIVVGSFNIEWFGHSNHPRTDDQIDRLADYIRSLEVDVLACQEIHPTGDRSNNDRHDWRDLLDALGEDFGAWYGNTGGSQRLALIWNKSRVTVSDIGELRGFEREPVDGTNNVKTFPRIPLTAYVESKRANGVDFRIVTVHLYWSVDQARFAEAKRLNDWVGELLAGDNDEDLVIIGDFNTKPMGAGETGTSVTIENLIANDHLERVSAEHDEFTTPESEERYDHAFLTSALMNEFIAGSWDVRREAVEAFPFQFMRDMSNHVPVTIQLRDEDDDADPAGDFGNRE